ncbi:unnamed protein product, partial [Laminaria digitata]
MHVLTESAGLVSSASGCGMTGSGLIGTGIAIGGRTSNTGTGSGTGVGNSGRGDTSSVSKRGRPSSTCKKSRLKDLLRKGYRCLALLEEVGAQRLLE